MPLAFSLKTQEKKIAYHIEKVLVACDVAASQYLSTREKTFMLRAPCLPVYWTSISSHVIN